MSLRARSKIGFLKIESQNSRIIRLCIRSNKLRACHACRAHWIFKILCESTQHTFNGKSLLAHAIASIAMLVVDSIERYCSVVPVFYGLKKRNIYLSRLSSRTPIESTQASEQ